MNQYKKAIEYADKAIDSLSSFVHYLSRGNFYAIIGDFEKAIEDFNEGIKNLRPLQTTKEKNYHKWLIAALYNRYDAYLKAGNNEKANEDFNELEELEPELIENAPPRFLFFMEMVHRQT